MPAIAVALLFGGLVVYTELQREIPEAEEHNHPVSEAGHTADPEIDRLQEVVDANPDDDESLLRLANLLQDHSSHEREYLVRAITAYQKYLGRNPGNENARVDLGICYFEMARTDTVHGTALIDRAISEISTVAEANPQHQAAAFNLGIVTLNVGRTEEAARWFERTVAINPESDLGVRANRLLEQHTFAQPSE
jgi:tetratricopeptide (TPR) repeat protein